MVGHLGESEDGYFGWSAEEVVAHTTGIDAVIDGHSNTVTEKVYAKNKNGEQIPITQTGTKLQYIGKMTISEDNKINTELISEVPAPTEDMNIPAEEWLCDDERGGRNIDRSTYDFINDLEAECEAQLSEVIGHSDFELTINDTNTGIRRIRSGETNLGDLCADFFKDFYNAEIGLINGGNIRDNINAGDIKLSDVFKTFPFMNEPATAKVTGQQIIDYLELGASSYPDENSSFCHVSGLTYEIDPSIKSSVRYNEYSEFVAVDGEYRVKNVTFSDGTPIDPNGKYTIAMTVYHLRDGGDAGIFSKNCSDLTILNGYDLTDFAAYINVDLGGIISNVYSDPKGQGRIVINSSSVLDFDTDSESDIDRNSDNSLQKSPKTGSNMMIAEALFAVLLAGLCLSSVFSRELHKKEQE